MSAYFLSFLVFSSFHIFMMESVFERLVIRIEDYDKAFQYYYQVGLQKNERLLFFLMRTQFFCVFEVFTFS